MGKIPYTTGFRSRAKRASMRFFRVSRDLAVGLEAGLPVALDASWHALLGINQLIHSRALLISMADFSSVTSGVEGDINSALAA